jgi:hypothetical protein
MHTKFLTENLKRRYHLEDLHVNGRTKLVTNRMRESRT